MKKLSAILLSALFVFNLFGYRLVFNYMQQHEDSQFKTSLDKQDYNEADLLMIKVPLSLPYITDQQNFERVNGEITVNGKILKYVKRKITRGNLILLCLPDENKMKLMLAKTEFFKYSNDLVQNNPAKKSGSSKAGVFKNFSCEYNSVFDDYANCYIGLIYSYTVETQLNFLPSSHQTLPEQPPELI